MAIKKSCKENDIYKYISMGYSNTHYTWNNYIKNVAKMKTVDKARIAIGQISLTHFGSNAYFFYIILEHIYIYI